jgi:hypothetical protein
VDEGALSPVLVGSRSGWQPKSLSAAAGYRRRGRRAPEAVCCRVRCSRATQKSVQARTHTHTRFNHLCEPRYDALP